jgi:hypothetical protein
LRLASGPRGGRPRPFCGFQLHGEASDHLLQLGDAALLLVALYLAPEEGIQALEGSLFPASDEFGLPLVLPGDLGLALQAGEDFEDDLVLELRRERPPSAFRHGRRLVGGQY